MKLWLERPQASFLGRGGGARRKRQLLFPDLTALALTTLGLLLRQPPATLVAQHLEEIPASSISGTEAEVDTGRSIKQPPAIITNFVIGEASDLAHPVAASPSYPPIPHRWVEEDRTICGRLANCSLDARCFHCNTDAYIFGRSPPFSSNATNNISDQLQEHPQTLLLPPVKCRTDFQCAKQRTFRLAIPRRFCWQLVAPEEMECQEVRTNCSTSDLRLYPVWCRALPQTLCLGKRTFPKMARCRWTSGHSWSRALAYSIFLGGFGVDRFYLGYWKSAIAKLFSFGGAGLWTLVDIVLIAIGFLQPADESLYI